MSTTIYLYLKTHNITGLKYLGKTEQDPYDYKGSGNLWKPHIKKHGNDVTTEILKVCKSKPELRKWGLYYSDLWNIVESKDFANKIPETGGGDKMLEETKRKLSEANKGKTLSEETKRKMSKSRLGNTNAIGYKHTEETKQKMSEDRIGRTHTEETKRKISKAKKGIPLSEEQKLKVSKGLTGKKQSEETIRKRAESIKATYAKRRAKQASI